MLSDFVLRMIVKESLFIAVLLVGSACFALAQTDSRTGPVIGILPFAGGVRGEGEIIADILSSRQEILDAFSVVPLSGEARAVISERLFHMAAFTDSDVIAEIGRMLGADYVVSGHVRRLGGNRHLVIATVVCVETLELVTGYYRTYRYIWEARNFVPSMSRSLVQATLERPTPGRLPRLAVAPFGTYTEGMILTAQQHLHDDDFRYGQDLTDPHDMETLMQILAIELANTGEYAVLPRASVMRAALGRWETRVTDAMEAALERLLELLLGDPVAGDETGYDEDLTGAITEIGRAADADFVLSVEVRGFGGLNMFAAQILHTEDESPLAGASRGYGTVGDGINLMAEIAIMLTDHYGAPGRITALNRQRRLVRMFDDPARLWTVGVSAGTSFAAPWTIGTLQATLAPFPFSFVRVGGDVGFVSGTAGIGYFSVYPFVHYAFFLPFSWGGWYIGIGGGFLIARHTFYGLVENRRGLLADFTTGFSINDMFDVSYTLRTDFSSGVNGKLSVGFTHRFRLRGM